MTADVPSSGAAAKATRTYPACAIEEYASKRLILSWTSAPILPSVIERAAEIQISQSRPGAFISKSTRSRTANVAAFGPVDMNPVIGAGAPSYTSGVQT
jgi:hypothetical protein